MINVVDPRGVHRARGKRASAKVSKRPSDAALTEMLQTKSRKEVAAELGVCRNTVANWAIEAGLGSGRRHKWIVKPPRDELTVLIKTETYPQLMARYEISRSALVDLLNEYDIASPHWQTKKASSTHHERVEAEFATAGLDWLRRPLTRRTEPGRLSYWVQAA